jgi:tetratricopeptide (TPR) repeat protein
MRTLCIMLVTAGTCAALAACTPAAQLALAVLPDGTVSMLLSHLERESDTNRRRVAEFEKVGDWNGLARFAEQNIAIQPANASWWLVAGHAYSRQNNHARAIDCYREIVRLEPQAPEGWNLLAQEYRLAGEPQQAVAILTRALIGLRDSPGTLVLLGESYSDLARYPQAAQTYRQALALDGNLAPAWAGLARAHVKLKQWAEAEQVARAVEKRDPKLAAAIRNDIKKYQ